MSDKIKVTFYISQADYDLLKELRVKRWVTIDRKPPFLSNIICEAIRLLHSKS